MQSDNKILVLKLNEAIRRLKGQEIIKWDKDIARDLKYEPPTINQYKKGERDISQEFLSRFKKKYKIDIETILLPAKGKEPVINDVNTKLLILIAKKVGVPTSEINKALK